MIIDKDKIIGLALAKYFRTNINNRKCTGVVIEPMKEEAF